LDNNTLNEIKNLIQTGKEYQEFRESEKVKNHLHLLCVSGSYAYGTNYSESDIDVRGIVGLEPAYANGAAADWETKTFSSSDTVIHSYRKMLHLLSKGNPDILAYIGQEKDQYLYLSDLGTELIEKHTDFLCANGIYRSCMGYVQSQLRRIELAELGKLAEKKKEKDSLKLSILNNATCHFHTRYSTIQSDNMKIQFKIPEAEEKIRIASMTLQDVSVEDFFEVARDLKHISGNFEKKENVKEASSKEEDLERERRKLNKLMMHTIRGMLTSIETLETGKVRICRNEDIPMFTDILNGMFLSSDGHVRNEYFQMVEDIKKAVAYAFEHSVLPKEPNMKKISDMMTEFVLYDLRKEP